MVLRLEEEERLDAGVMLLTENIKKDLSLWSCFCIVVICGKVALRNRKWFWFKFFVLLAVRI